MEIKITRTAAPRPKPADPTKLGFGTVFTDHMFTMDYDVERGWHDAEIVPLQDLRIHPGAAVFHYGAEVFEGLKAYRTICSACGTARSGSSCRISTPALCWRPP